MPDENLFRLVLVPNASKALRVILNQPSTIYDAAIYGIAGSTTKEVYDFLANKGRKIEEKTENRCYLVCQSPAVVKKLQDIFPEAIMTPSARGLVIKINGDFTDVYIILQENIGSIVFTIIK